MTDDPHALEAGLAGDLLTSDMGLGHLVALADRFGGRAAGSLAEADAAAYLIETLLTYMGTAPLVQPFRYLGWERGGAALRLTAPIERELPAIALPGSPSGEIEAELVSIGAGEEEDFAAAGPAVRGRIALCGAEAPRSNGRPPSHRRIKYRRAVDAGAVGFLYVGRNPGMLAVTGGIASTATAPIPGFGLAAETGAFLERLLARETVTLRLSMQHTHNEVTSSNVVAEIPGRTEETVLVGAHYDGHDIGQAATDNGSGVAVVLELMRAMAGWHGRLQRSIRFCLWGSEECGLLGSWRYVRTAAGALDPVVWVLNLDTVVNGPPGRLRLRAWPPPALDALAPLLASGSLATDLMGGLTSDSDHFPFAASGLPVIAAGSAPSGGLVGRGWGHTVADTVDKVDPVALALAAATAGRLVVRLAELAPAPARLQGDALTEVLADAGRLEAAQRGEELRYL